MEIQDELINRLNNFQNAPFLFIGSGISKRYIELDNWNSLLKRFSDKMGKPYEYYFSKGGGHLPTVGGLIAEEFHDYWFKSNGYLENPEKYSSQLVNIDSPLKLKYQNI